MRLLVAACLFCLSFYSLASESSEPVTSSARPSYQEPFTMEAVTQLVLGLLLVVGVILLLSWLLRRFTGFMPVTKNMQVLGVLPLSAREKAMLVKVGDKQILLGVAPGRVSHLHTFDEPVVNDDQVSVSFAEKLSDVIQQNKGRKDGE